MKRSALLIGLASSLIWVCALLSTNSPYFEADAAWNLAIRHPSTLLVVLSSSTAGIMVATLVAVRRPFRIAAVLIVVPLAGWGLQAGYRRWLAPEAQGEVFLQSTHGHSNRELVEEARDALDGVLVAASGGSVRPHRFPDEAAVSWLKRHAPESVDYHPPGSVSAPKDFLNDRFSVRWRYQPRCEPRRFEGLTHEVWYSPDGNQCMGGTIVTVVLTTELEPVRVDHVELKGL